MVKIHPTLQLAIDKESLYYDCLNPATNRSTRPHLHRPGQEQPAVQEADHDHAVQVHPERRAGDVLQSYKYVNGKWVLAPWARRNGPHPAPET